MNGKEYTIVKTRKGKETEVTGTLEYLIDYFRYTLEVAASWGCKINMKPKTINAFVNNLNKAYDVKEGACYDRTFVELKKKEKK